MMGNRVLFGMFIGGGESLVWLAGSGRGGYLYQHFHFSHTETDRTRLFVLSGCVDLFPYYHHHQQEFISPSETVKKAF